MPEPSDREWRELVEVLGEVADTVTDEQIQKIEEEEKGNPENPAEDKAAKAAESKEEEKPKSAEKLYTQEQLEQLIKHRLGETKQREEKAAEKARREAAEKAAEENEEFKTLATSRAERITELEAENERLGGVEEKATAYADTLNTYAEARLNELNLPKGVSKLLESFDPKEKLDWLSENGEDFATHERVLPADEADETGTPEADEAALNEQAAYTRNNF